MKVSIDWLKQLVGLNLTPEELAKKLSLHTIAIRELTDKYLELDMKGYNRADLLSLRGVALEVSALTDSPVKFTDPEKFVWDDQALPELKVTVEDKKLASVYCLAKIEGLKVQASHPLWEHKLEDCGMRSVNNIADVTNLIMLEYGQPMHAFDASEVDEEIILVRVAQKNEEIKTLDGKIRKLTSEDLLITDYTKPLGIAGVMGGQNSEITDKTTTILLEAAIFDPISIRKTAAKLGLQSEASKRFQHGLTKKRLFQALDSAIRMYADMGGKLTGLTIVGDTSDKEVSLDLSLKHTNSLIGIELEKEQISIPLAKLGFNLEEKGDSWKVKVPYWRLDIEYEEDLIEEVARMYGYHQIPSNTLPGEPPAKIDQTQFELIDKTKAALEKLGLTEVQTYSFFSTKVLEALGWNKELESLIKIENPMSAETTYLRYSVWPNLLEVVDKNLKVGIDDIAVFELGKMYQLTEEETIQEGYELAIALMNGSDNPIDELHQIVKSLFETLNLEITLTPSESPDPVKGIFHPNRFIKLEYKGQMIGGISEVHPRTLDQFGINSRVAVIGFELNTLF